MPDAIFISGYHEKNSNILHLFFRTDKLEKVEVTVSDFYPYFFVELSSGKYESLTGEKLEKIVCEYPEEVEESRKGYKKTYESDIPFVLRFLIDKGIYSAVKLPELKPLNKIVKIKPRVCYIDIENVGEEMIAWTIYDSYENLYVSAVLADKEKWKEDDNRIIYYYSNEYDLVKGLFSVLELLEPDVFAGWNIGYDVEFIRNKFKMYNLSFNFGSSDYFDIYSAYMRLYKAMSTRLKDVAIDEGITKTVIEWEEAYEAWKNGDYDKMIEYNFSDVYYCVEIDKNRKLFDFFWRIKQFVGLHKLYVQDYQIVTTGTIVDTLALRFAKSMNKVLPKKGSANEVEYEGAFVLDPIPGRHKNLAVFDFARTYPTIILALNISPETKIKTNGKIDFIKDKEGLLAKICRYLLEERERIEEEMKKYNPYSEEWKILKSMRDVVKFTTNAVYGYAGWTKSRVYDVDCASMITGVARDLMIHAVNYAKELGLEVVYGDSVTPDTPVLIKYKDRVEIINFDELWNCTRIWKKVKRADGKIEAYPPTDLYVLTKKGWTKVKKIIRHKVNEKEIYDIFTTKCFVSVTDDHSLIIDDKVVSAKDVVEKYGRIERVSNEDMLPKVYSLDEDIAWLYGFWLGNGISGVYKSEKCNVKYSWHIDNQNLEKLEKARRALKKLGFDGKIIDISKSDKVFRLVLSGDHTLLAIKFIRECLNSDGTKRVPYFILMGDRKTKEAFIKGFIDAYGYIEKRSEIIEMATTDKTLAAGICAILEDLGYEYSIYYLEEKDSFKIRIVKRTCFKESERGDIISKVIKRKYTGYVYDLETDNHHFTAGIGNVLLHNTDSTIVKVPWIEKFDPDTHVKELEEIGKKMTKEVSRYFREKYNAKYDIKMKFERFAIMGFFPPVKKRYVLRVIWEEKPCDVIVIKGHEAIRTDTSKFAREFLKKFFSMILDENTTIDEIRNFVKQSFEEFKKRSIEEICMRKGLSKYIHEYKSKQDYVRAAEYANKYLGCNFTKGSKVKYIYVKSVKGLPKVDVIAFEHEKQIKDKVVIDWDRMIEKQLYSPIEDILKQIGIRSIRYKVRRISDLMKKNK